MFRRLLNFGGIAERKSVFRQLGKVAKMINNQYCSSDTIILLSPLIQVCVAIPPMFFQEDNDQASPFACLPASDGIRRQADLCRDALYQPCENTSIRPMTA